MKSATLADWNGDNRPDLAVTRNNDTVAAYENKAGNWLRVNVPAAKAPGARITLTRGTATQTTELAAGTGYLGQNVSSAFFGIGTSTTAGKIRVQYANGTAAEAAFDGKAGIVTVKAAK